MREPLNLLRMLGSKIASISLLAALLVSTVTPMNMPRASAAPMPSAANFSDKEIDELLGPIALYPDPLLAQVIPAATFVDQVVLARQVLKGSTNEQLIQNQTWDVSVKSVAHYPQVLEMMASQQDWTTAVGQAYVNQSTDVIKSIQRLRAVAKSSGALVSTSQQTVTVQDNYITIVPAQAGYIYVPTYNPQVVYVSSGPSPAAVAAISFGVGLAVGAWLNRDWHWHGGGIYYHGWSGAGWIGVNRTRIRVNNIYVNRSFTHVNVNRTVVNRNINTFRADLNTRSVSGRQLDINRGAAGSDYRRPATMPARTANASRTTTASRTNNTAVRHNNSSINKSTIRTSSPTRSTTNTQRTVDQTRRSGGRAQPRRG